MRRKSNSTIGNVLHMERVRRFYLKMPWHMPCPALKTRFFLKLQRSLQALQKNHSLYLLLPDTPQIKKPLVNRRQRYREDFDKASYCNSLSMRTIEHHPISRLYARN